MNLIRLSLFIALFLPSSGAYADDVKSTSLSEVPVACVESIAPNANNPEFASAKEVIATSKNISSDDYLNAWMYLRAAKAADEKVNAIYEAADKYDMPPIVLTGAMMQESNLDSLPLTEDFGNWACGMGQINVNDWCYWASSLNADDKRRIDWSQSSNDRFQEKNPSIDLCSSDFVVPDHAQAFHSVLMSRLHAASPGAKEFMMDASYAVTPARIQFSEVKREFSLITKKHQKENDDDSLADTSDENAAQQLRFEITRNFVENCLDSKNAAQALAYNLRQTFDALPAELKEAQRYKDGQAKKSGCQRTPSSSAYPLHVGWLLADAVYNAGDEILPGVFTYQRRHHIDWEEFSPQDLVHAIDYALTLKNSGLSPIGAREAVHHIRGVVRAVTLPGNTIAK